MTTEKLELALSDPAATFAAPGDVLSDAELSHDEKIKVLLKWEYDASSEAVALEEGMPGEESDDLRQVLLALGKIAGPIDVNRGGPTKQHGVSKSQIGTRARKI